MKELQRARITCLLSHPFFAYLLMGLEEKLDPDLPAVAATDGKTLFIQPEGFLKLSDDERVGVLAHEAYHLALGHPARTGARNHKLWSMACDYQVNHCVAEDGLKLPSWVLRSAKYDKMPSEAVYEDLLRRAKQVSGDGLCDASSWGSKDDKGQAKYDKEEWTDKIASAAEAARIAGKLPASVGSLIEGLLHPKLDWRSMLQEYIQAAVKNDYRRSPPNKHHLWRGMILPSTYGEEVEVGVAIDTSGSISDKELVDFLSEVRGIMSQFDGYKIHIWQCDAVVQNYTVVSAIEGELPTKIKGRGGTDFRPVFAAVQEQAIDLPILVYFTDGEGAFPDSPPGYQVLWVLTRDTEVPFGASVVLR